MGECLSLPSSISMSGVNKGSSQSSSPISPPRIAHELILPSQLPSQHHTSADSPSPPKLSTTSHPSIPRPDPNASVNGHYISCVRHLGWRGMGAQRAAAAVVVVVEGKGRLGIIAQQHNTTRHEISKDSPHHLFSSVFSSCFISLSPPFKREKKNALPPPLLPSLLPARHAFDPSKTPPSPQLLPPSHGIPRKGYFQCKKKELTNAARPNAYTPISRCSAPPPPKTNKPQARKNKTA